ncbi:hypothetical protein C2E23DRAFT_892906 [Lenzites betulinus]|nr:hypothetical protein C2E23DRAFT_892906 [Lenzites betulinus]
MAKEIPCTSHGCGKLGVSALCAHQLCAAHCRMAITGCGFRPHNKARKQEIASRETTASRHAGEGASTSHDGFTLVRPKPVYPHDPRPTSPAKATPMPSQNNPTPGLLPPSYECPPAVITSMPAIPELPQKALEVPMPPVWQERWQLDRHRAQEKLAAEQARRENEKAEIESVVVWFWGDNNAEPVRQLQQGLKAYPTMKLADHPRILARLALGESDDIQVYDLDIRYWQFQNVTDSFNVKRTPILLIRRVGVTSCTGIDLRIAEAERATVNSTPPLSSIGSSPPPSMASLDDLAGLDHSNVAPMSLHRDYHPWPSTDTFMLSGRTTEEDFSSGLQLQLSVPMTTPDDATLDELWSAGEVYVPPDAKALIWPHGLYTRDLAKGLSLLSALQSSLKAQPGERLMDRKLTLLPAQFAQVFPGCKFVLKTYYTQRSVWKNATEHERTIMLQQPRVKPQGLWTTFRGDLPAWTSRKVHRKAL